MGTPIKVLVGEQRLYLCCRGCVSKVEENPQAYLPATRTAQPPPIQNGPRGQVLVSEATTADEARIRVQRLCPVLRTPLGEHGIPIRVSTPDQEMFVCCRGCLAQVEKNPEFYFAQAAELRKGL